MELLPKWNMTKSVPAFEDHESATCMEQTYKLYQTMQNLIKEYNDFVDETNAKLVEFAKTYEGDIEVFTTSLRQEFQDFIDITDLKLQALENDIEKLQENNGSEEDISSWPEVEFPEDTDSLELTENTKVLFRAMRTEELDEGIGLTIKMNGFKCYILGTLNEEQVGEQFITFENGNYGDDYEDWQTTFYNYVNLGDNIGGYGRGYLTIRMNQDTSFILVEEKNNAWKLTSVGYGES